ncbi:hypothetical protein QJS04_geneDACA012284 [Acorus gramineus]|uniref:Uncharacterized protein n=1 Tax=Acorus gramineus TaxID=55184 RepID=A0AAV9A283_ACOGR|nr:hypothetical protein QJS04_geneDACA012284 [Acorus gramineus]
MALVTPPSPHNPHHPDLYIANTYHSLMMVDRMGSVTTPVSTHVEGKLILFANELDIHKNESIFFTNTNMRYNRRDMRKVSEEQHQQSNDQLREIRKMIDSLKPQHQQQTS